MKRVFETNTKYARIKGFLLINVGMCLFQLFYLTTQGENSSVWWSISFALVFALLFFIFSREYMYPNKVEIGDYYFTFYYPFTASRKIAFEELEYYARVSCGGPRIPSFHGLVFVFKSNYKTLVTEHSILNYKGLLDFVNNRSFENYGYIGSNSWRRKEKPVLQKKSFVDYEKELIKDIDKSKGKSHYYFNAVLAAGMNIFMLYLLLFEI